jgi:hypothetical protein
MADNEAVDRECDRARHHRLTLHGCVAGTMLVNCDAERGKRDGRRGPEQAGKALGAQDVAEHREGRYERASDDEADDVLGHLAFFHSFDRGRPLPYTGSLRSKATLGMAFSARGRFATVVHSSYVAAGG